MKKIAVLTSGGDAPGMNGAIRAIVRVGIKHGFEVYGIYEGYRGLVEGKIARLGYRDVSEILAKGGTILESSRLPEFTLDEVQDRAINNLKEHEIDSLVVIGGDGSYRGAQALAKKGINCIGIPGTIDNDINGTDETIGFHTALCNIIDAVNKLRDTSSLGHIQRGGSPVPEDRILAARMANKAIELLQDNQSGKCVCLQDGKIVAKDIETALQEVNKSNQMLYQLFDDLV